VTPSGPTRPCFASFAEAEFYPCCFLDLVTQHSTGKQGNPYSIIDRITFHGICPSSETFVLYFVPSSLLIIHMRFYFLFRLSTITSLTDSCLLNSAADLRRRSLTVYPNRYPVWPLLSRPPDPRGATQPSLFPI
jgi:hypothetical protein